MDLDAHRIFVVDDDPSMTRLVEVAFRHEPVEVIRIHGAFGLLTRVAEERPAVVVLDVMMPGLDGPGWIELLRADEELRETPVILWSALPPEPLAARARAVGADAYRTKTDGPRALVGDVLRLMAR